MVGGDVIGFARHPDNTLVNVRDCTYGDTCAVRIIERRRDTGEAVALAVGDKIWWPGNDVMWTPQWVKVSSGRGCGTDWDIRLPKIGYSH